ncbi:hypothetical protein E3N88_28349 [Mikania micrantha]|uniref:Cytochrome P450 n=1 Tax=Mikania micrantha TaxID=192012 RepID=A0A5N6MZI0_9ASTR|nr:hypothetical protein E3N88_28349 [Mikania micrantha]
MMAVETDAEVENGNKDKVTPWFFEEMIKVELVEEIVFVVLAVGGEANVEEGDEEEKKKTEMPLKPKGDPNGHLHSFKSCNYYHFLHPAMEEEVIIWLQPPSRPTIAPDHRELASNQWKTTPSYHHKHVPKIRGSFSEIFPSYGWILEDLSGWTRRLDKHIASYDALIEMMIDEHIDHSNVDEKDLIDVCKSSLTRKEMKALMTNVFNGAVETSYLALVWVMAMLVKNPRVMHKLQAEIRSHSGKKSTLDETDTAKMTYLKNVIKETLRLHGPAPFLISRHCVEHIQIGGYDILPGTNVLICSREIAKDPMVWTENVNEFYPERFENRVVDQFDMTPFGGGRRSCPGFNLATSILEVVVANLFNNIDWKAPNGMRNEDLDVEENEEGSLLVAKKTPLYLVPVKHNSQA